MRLFERGKRLREIVYLRMLSTTTASSSLRMRRRRRRCYGLLGRLTRLALAGSGGREAKVELCAPLPEALPCPARHAYFHDCTRPFALARLSCFASLEVCFHYDAASTLCTHLSSYDLVDAA